MAPFVLSVNGISILFLSVSFVSSHFHPNQASISHFILISQLPQPIIISPVCVSQCLLLSFYFTLDLSPCDFFSSLYSVSLFHLVLLSCLLPFFYPNRMFWFHFEQGMFKKEEAKSQLIKSLWCTFISPKSKNSTKWLTLDLFFFSSSLTSQTVTVWWQVQICCWLSETEAKKKPKDARIQRINVSASEWGAKKWRQW